MTAVAGFAVGAVCGAVLAWTVRSLLAREDRDAALRMLAFYRYQHEQALGQLAKMAGQVDPVEAEAREARAWWDGLAVGEAFAADTYFQDADNLRANPN